MSQESFIETKSQHLKGYPKVPKSITTAKRCEYKNIKLRIIDGCLPKGLQGHIFLVASVGTVESRGLPYHNGDCLLCGDGMIYRLDFDSPGEVKLTTSIVKPPDYYADEVTSNKQSKYNKYHFRNHGLTRFSLSLGIRNQLNTAFLRMKFSSDSLERLLVTYDAGRPYEIDTETLKVVTPIGCKQEWQSEVNGYDAPFPPFLSTAHPAFDHYTQQMFTVNYGRSLINFLDAIPFIYNLEQLPQEIDEFLTAFVSFLHVNFFKDILNFFSQSFHTLVQLYVKLIKKMINIEIDNFVYLISWDGVGALERWKLVLPDGSPVQIYQTIHQIGVTRDYVVLMDTAFTTGLQQVLNNPCPENKQVEEQFREVLERSPLPYSLVYIVPRACLKPDAETVEVQKVVLPLEAAHFLVDYDNPEASITLNAAHICGMDISEWIRKYDVSAYIGQTRPNPWGMVPGQCDIGRMGRYVIHGETGYILKSEIIFDVKYTWGVDLYTYPERDPKTGEPLNHLDDIYWCSFGLWKDLMTKFLVEQYKNYKNRRIPLDIVLSMASNCIPASLFRLHSSSTEGSAIVDSYELPSGYVLLSPQFMPHRDAQKSTDGYIICTVWHGKENEYWIFDANDLSRGPLCKLSYDSLDFALTLHTAWLPSIGRRQAPYCINVRKDYAKSVAQAAKQYPDIQDLFEDYVYPNFESASKPLGILVDS